MKFTVEYIPLSKIKPDASWTMTRSIKKLRRIMWDCMYLLAVRKNGRDGTYTLIRGLERFEYLRTHTKKKHAPCIVETGKSTAHNNARIRGSRSQQVKEILPFLKARHLTPASGTILRKFARSEPRFKRLTAGQKIIVLAMGIRYKRTVVASMKAKVDEMLLQTIK